jgi:hypothetical protein
LWLEVEAVDECLAGGSAVAACGLEGGEEYFECAGVGLVGLDQLNEDGLVEIYLIGGDRALGVVEEKGEVGVGLVGYHPPCVVFEGKGAGKSKQNDQPDNPLRHYYHYKSLSFSRSLLA